MILRTIVASIIAAMVTVPVAYAACDATDTGRFVVNGAEVYDTKTNLTWQRCSVGQTWQQDKCTGSVQALSWDQAKKQARGKWRLPTRDELVGLTEMPCGMSAETKKIFPDMDYLVPMYWSETAPDAGLAWLVGFNNGSTFNGYRTAPNGVRLVRTGR